MKKLQTLSFLPIVLLLLLSALCAGCSNDYQHISGNEAMKMMKSLSNVLVVDVRTKEEYDKRHIPHALWIPIEDIREGKLDALPDKNRPILLYCWTGRRAEDSAVMLVKYGYRNVYEFGGLVDWTGETVGKE